MCNAPTAIFAFKRGLLPDGDLYKELTKYTCKTMEDLLSRAWVQVKREEEVTSRAMAQQKQNQKMAKQDKNDRDERSSHRSANEEEIETWVGIKPTPGEGLRDGSVH